MLQKYINLTFNASVFLGIRETY